MWFIDQTDFTPTGGNCFQACLASLLEKPLEDVPHFMMKFDTYPQDMDKWLKDQGLWYIDARVDGTEGCITLPSHMLCIVSGQSPRFPEVQHAVIGRTRESGSWMVDYIHDPYAPDPSFLGNNPMRWLLFIGGRVIKDIPDGII